MYFPTRRVLRVFRPPILPCYVDANKYKVCTTSRRMPRTEKLRNQSGCYSIHPMINYEKLQKSLRSSSDFRRLIWSFKPCSSACLHRHSLSFELAVTKVPILTEITQRGSNPINNIRVPYPVITPVALHPTTKTPHDYGAQRWIPSAMLVPRLRL